MVIPHYRLRIGGDLFSSASWSVGCAFLNGQGDDGGGISGQQAKLDSWRDAIPDLNAGKIVDANLLSLLSSSGRIGMIRCSHVGANGREDMVSLLEMGSPVAGSSQAEKTAQSALCFSLRTGTPGRANRGRVYWPALHASTGGLGNLDRSALPQFALSMAQFLVDVGNAGSSFLTPGLRPYVVSTSSNNARRVQQVAVGNRLDSQRRRAESQEELYGVASVPQ